MMPLAELLSHVVINDDWTFLFLLLMFGLMCQGHQREGGLCNDLVHFIFKLHH